MREQAKDLKLYVFDVFRMDATDLENQANHSLVRDFLRNEGARFKEVETRSGTAIVVVDDLGISHKIRKICRDFDTLEYLMILPGSRDVQVVNVKHGTTEYAGRLENVGTTEPDGQYIFDHATKAYYRVIE